MENFKNLDQTVMDGLEFLKKQKLSRIVVPRKQKILVIGSGNALMTGQIIFRNNYAIYANESNFRELLKLHLDVRVVVVISASGSKHAPLIIRHLKNIRKKIILLTSTQNSQAEILLSDYRNKQVRVYPKLSEMYTYNFTTYLAMILPHTSDSIQDIINFLNKKISIDEIEIGKYSSFFFIIPDKFTHVARMLHIKFMELFGRNVGREIETEENMMHATTVVPSEELFISFNKNNKHYGDKRLHIKLPKHADYAFMVATAYFLIGKIQRNKEAMFAKNISEYIERTNRIHNLNLKVFG